MIYVIDNSLSNIKMSNINLSSEYTERLEATKDDIEI